MRLTLSELASALDADMFGDGTLVIEGLAEPANAGPTDLALAAKESYAATLGDGQAEAALLWPGADASKLGLKGALIPKRPRHAMSVLTRLTDPGQGYSAGIHPSAIIDPSANLADDVSVGPFTVISAGVKIGSGSVIGPQCFIGVGTELGPNAYLRDHVSLGAGVRIGENFIAQPGAVIGGDGFSFVTETTSNVETARGTLGNSTEATEQPWHRIHSLGGVVIDDDVEIGANSCIDSGTIRPTRVGQGTKIDNHVHIGHNCIVGRNCLLCGQVGLAGSATLGNSVVLAGQVGVSDNISIGDGVVAGGASVILSNVPAGRAILGYPATKMESQIDSYKALRRLPRVLKEIAELKKAVFKTPSND